MVLEVYGLLEQLYRTTIRILRYLKLGHMGVPISQILGGTKLTRPVEKHMHCVSYDNDFSYGFFTGTVTLGR